MDRVGARRAPRVRLGKAGARGLHRDPKRHAPQRRGRALPLAGGEQEPKLKTAIAGEAGRARARAEAERALAEAAAKKPPEEAVAERPPEEAAAKRALAELTA